MKPINEYHAFTYKTPSDRRVVLVNNTYQIHVVVACYFVFSLHGLQWNTYRKHIGALKDYVNWNLHQGCNIESDFPKGRLEPYIGGLERYSIFLTNGRSHKVYPLPHITVDQVGMISRVQHDLIMGYIERFLEWSIQRYISPRYINTNKDFVALKQAVLWDLSKKTTRKYSKASKGKSEEREFKSLSTSELALMVGAARPNSPNNPFLSSAVKTRNYLILLLMKDLGLRVGELIGLRLDDLQMVSQGRYYFCIRKHSDNQDPRHSKATLKTVFSERTIAISSDLARGLEYYIVTIRKALVTREINHPYIFVAEGSGSPLSDCAVGKMLDALARACSEHGAYLKVTPRMLRHTWATAYLEYLVEQKKMTLEGAKDSLRKIGGWSDKSLMPSRYAKRFIVKAANTTNMERVANDYQEFEAIDE